MALVITKSCRFEPPPLGRHSGYSHQVTLLVVRPYVHDGEVIVCDMIFECYPHVDELDVLRQHALDAAPPAKSVKIVVKVNMRIADRRERCPRIPVDAVDDQTAIYADSSRFLFLSCVS